MQKVRAVGTDVRIVDPHIYRGWVVAIMPGSALADPFDDAIQYDKYLRREMQKDGVVRREMLRLQARVDRGETVILGDKLPSKHGQVIRKHLIQNSVRTMKRQIVSKMMH